MTQLINIKGINTPYEESILILTKSTAILKITFKKGLNCNYTKVIVERNGKPEMSTDYPNDKLEAFTVSIKQVAIRTGYTEVLQ